MSAFIGFINPLHDLQHPLTLYYYNTLVISFVPDPSELTPHQTFGNFANYTLIGNRNYFCFNQNNFRPVEGREFAKGVNRVKFSQFLLFSEKLM